MPIWDIQFSGASKQRTDFAKVIDFSSSIQITEAIRLQMEVQHRLQQQLEVKSFGSFSHEFVILIRNLYQFWRKKTKLHCHLSMHAFRNTGLVILSHLAELGIVVFMCN